MLFLLLIIQTYYFVIIPDFGFFISNFNNFRTNNSISEELN